MALVINGAVTMNTTSNTNITSTKGVTLISPITSSPNQNQRPSRYRKAD
jgi:hypothetical protein